MKTADLKGELRRLSKREKLNFIAFLKSSLQLNLDKTVCMCPRCNSSKIIKNGSESGIQRYMCKECKKQFNYKTSTVLTGTHLASEEKIMEMLNMFNHKHLPTIKEIADMLNIAGTTAFAWRSKILSALYREVSMDNQILEFDETMYQISRKGRKGMDSKFSRKRGKSCVGDNKYAVKVFMTYSRSTKRIDFMVSHMGKTKAQQVANRFDSVNGAHVYSDMHKSYGAYFKKSSKLVHQTFRASDHVNPQNKRIHNQTINVFSGKLTLCFNFHHRGISTKHMQEYCNWMNFFQNYVRQGEHVSEKITENKVAMQIHRQKEKEFQYFLAQNGRSNWGACNINYVLSKAA